MRPIASLSTPVLLLLLTLASRTLAVPTPFQPETSIVERATVDGDDAVVYSWSIDSQDKTKKEKKRRDDAVADGDDAVVYSWAIDSEEK